MNKITNLSVSILSSDMMKLGNTLRILNDYNIKTLHIDIMDGHFVPNISIGHFVLKQIKEATNAILDVHLMVQNPELHIRNYAPYSDILTIHYESTIHIDAAIKMIRDTGIKAGLAIVPSTHELVLDYLYDILDQITVMTVNPGMGGQQFIPSQLKKIAYIHEKLLFLNKSDKILLSVDGGVNEANIQEIVKHGANSLVVGNAIFKDGETKIGENIMRINAKLNP